MYISVSELDFLKNIWRLIFLWDILRVNAIGKKNLTYYTNNLTPDV